MEPTGLAGHNRNARVSHIRKFVCVPPERGHVLRLVTVEDHATILGEWLREACLDNGSTAEEVDSRLREHASTVQAEITANLVWQAEDGLVVVTKRLRCKPEIDGNLMDPGQVAVAEALGINGTIQGTLIQTQRGLEAMMRSYFSAHQTQIGQGNQLIGILGGLLSEAQQNAHRAHLELDKIRAQQRRELDAMFGQLMQAQNSEDAPDPEAAARMDLLKQIGGAMSAALPFILQKAMEAMQGGGGPSNDNGSAPPSSSSSSG